MKNLSVKWEQRCAAIDNNAITAFKSFLKKMGWSFCGFSNENQDKFQHIDCFVKDKNGRHFSVDIKGLKREISCQKILIELQNVAGNRGWLFGRADIIAFQVNENEFLFVSRNDIFREFKERFGLSVSVKGNFRADICGRLISHIEECFAPNYYARQDRPREKVTFLPIENLRKIALDF